MTLRHKIKFAKHNYLKKKQYYQAWNFDSVLGENEITPWRGEEAKLLFIYYFFGNKVKKQNWKGKRKKDKKKKKKKKNKNKKQISEVEIF